MPVTPKYKLNELAKNFDKKNKDVIDVFNSLGMTGKSHAASLENNELNLFFEYPKRIIIADFRQKYK